MSDIISPLLQWLNANPELAGLVTFIISASESVAIIGTIVPGSIMMTALGTLAGAGVIPLWPTIFWAIIGAIVGDGISYWLGHYFKDRLKVIWPFRNYPGLIESGEVFFHKYGAMSVFIGRYVGPVRALVPLVAGMLGMKPLPFTIANVLSAIGWAPAYMLPGILLGAASLELPPDIAVHVMLVLLLITLFILLCLWLLYKLLMLYHNQTDQLQNWIWQYLKKSRALFPITVLLKHHDPHKTHGQLNLVFYFLFTTFLFFCLVIYVKAHGAPNLMVNDALYHLFRGIRTKSLDDIMINITLLGQKQVILPVVLVIFAWLITWKRWRAAFHALALGILAAGSVYILKHLIQSSRPWGIFFNAETYSMPSGHTTIATTLFMGLAFLIASAVRPKYRWPIYTCGIFISFMVGVSRLYLGAHWFTDVLAAWLLASAVLMLVIISYERRLEKPVNPIGIVFITLASFAITYGFFHHYHFDHLKINYAKINWPPAKVTMSEWWMKNNSLPAYQVSLFGFPSQAINIVWAGNISRIRETLESEGWVNPPARDWVSTLHRVADVKSTQYLSMISHQYLDKRPELILVRHVNGLKGLIVLRLWDSNRIIKENGSILWVGTVGTIPRSYSWLYKSHRTTFDIHPDYIFPLQTKADLWEWKIITMDPPAEANKVINQKILLIREK
ncbi:MAG: VTT domain-containing protein [Gammaproteobacteria bacterium]|nr:VTT domain-containing protein [Gammaproteobacteria bacterium]MCW5584055.1 VTT domain-containing protein [Gammaproteobacteria bacterium]